VTVLADVLETGRDDRGAFAFADCAFYVDGLRIYEAPRLGMRVVLPADVATASGEETLDPARDAWVADHRPTWTVPALPMTVLADRLAAAAARLAPGLRVVGIEDLRVARWVIVEGPLRLRATASPSKTADDGPGVATFEARLEAWRDAGRPELARFETVATARVVLAPEYPRPVALQPSPDAPDPVPCDPYDDGRLFHGPAFQHLRARAVWPGGASAVLDAAPRGVPAGVIAPGLLDAVTHVLPHDDVRRLSPAAPANHAAYPQRVERLEFFADPPQAGEVRVEGRFDGSDGGDAKRPRFVLSAAGPDGRPWVRMVLVEVMLPLGPVGSATPRQRRDFLERRGVVPGVALSAVRASDDATVLAEADVRGSDWLPGTVAHAYDLAGVPAADMAVAVAVRDHAARRMGLHPSSVRVGPIREGRTTASAGVEPLASLPVTVDRSGGLVTVRDDGPAGLDTSLVRDYWNRFFGLGRWPVEDLYFGLIDQFVGRVRVVDPAALDALRGRGVLYLANHQVAVESLLFSILASGLSGVPTLTLAKAEHRETWLGTLIGHAFSWPGAWDPGVITFFDRADRENLPRVVADLGSEVTAGGKSVMVHVEGTRSLTCRAPVERFSGAFIDMAVATGTPIVPVRFAGGLPVAPLVERIEFPVGMGRQDLWFGRPLLPVDLAPLPYAARKQAVAAALNDLGPSHETEEPSASDQTFADAVQTWADRTGASHEDATVFQALGLVASPTPDVASLIDGARTGRLEVSSGARGAWLADLARRLYGPRGPAVVEGRVEP
jgi:1-acyl-sn-glycerol-3-phosphate acyltransferase